LTGDIEGDGIGAVLADNGLEALGHISYCVVPIGGRTVNLRLQQSTFMIDCFAEYSVLGTQPTPQ
jgi:hypothetical protein